MDIITIIKAALLVQELLKVKADRNMISRKQIEGLGVSEDSSQEVTALLDQVEPEFIANILNGLSSIFKKDDVEKLKSDNNKLADEVTRLKELMTQTQVKESIKRG